MIINVDGKNLVFGMQWRSILSQVNVHKEAHAAKSKYLWHGEKEVYFGLLGEDDRTAKLTAPLYSAAIALTHIDAHAPNILMVLSVPKTGTGEQRDTEHGKAGVGYLVCAIHQGRPYNQFDCYKDDETEVSFLIESFKSTCGADGFVLMGDALLDNIRHLSLHDLAQAADSHAQLKKVQSQLVSPVVMAVGVACLGAAVAFSYQAYQKHKRAEAARKAMATQKNSQQLYEAELAQRREDVTFSASEVPSVLAVFRSMRASVGGWTLTGAVCNLATSKQLSCALVYQRSRYRQATNKTFSDAAGKQFRSITYGQQKIDTTMTIEKLNFSVAGKAIDSAVSVTANELAFGSQLQEYSNLGAQTLKKFEPYAVPAGANATELSTPPNLIADWEFNGPLSSLDLFKTFPASAVVTNITLKITEQTLYEAGRSFASVKVTGKIIAKPV